MRCINVLRTLALSSALILAIGTTACASDEESDEKGEPATVEASPPAEAPEEAADDTSPPAEKPDTEASEAEEE